MAEVEVIKLQKHLALLREEYVKLQNKYTELEKKYNLLSSISNQNNQNPHFDPNESYISRLLKTISELFDKDLYSDLKVILKNQTELKAHKFVLDARSKNWNSQNLSSISELDLTDVDYEISFYMIKWCYTDQIENSSKHDEDFYLEMMRQADRFGLKELKLKCEDGLLTYVSMKNCIKFYEVAEQISALTLKAHCNELISNHWEDFTSDDFASMPASLLYQMFKDKTKYPLHTAIKARREDVVFLYFIENDSILQIKLNEFDDKNELPLDLALKTRQESIAKNLVKNHINIDKTDNQGLTLLHKAVLRDDEYSASFLVDNNISVNTQSLTDKRTALMYLAAKSSISNEMLNLVRKILKNHNTDVNLRDQKGNTALHIAIYSKNKSVFKEILLNSIIKPNLNIKNNDEQTILWLALLQSEDSNDFDQPDSFPSMLIDKGCEIDTTDSNGDTLLHLCARKELEHAAIFLVNKKAKLNLLNNDYESVLHVACEYGLMRLVDVLLDKNADPNVQSSKLTNSQTPMHKAILNNHENILQIFIRVKANKNGKVDSSLIPNFNIKDNDGQTVLSLCLWSNMLSLAKSLIEHGADVNITDNEDIPLLHQAILRQCTEAALFLLEQKVDINAKSCEDNLTALQLAVKRHLPLVVENLCRRGADMSVLDSEGNSPLWNALDSGQEDIASILVNSKCDTTQWSSGPEGCQQTLLHRAIDENNDAVAIFLIKSGCDINSPRRPGLNGETPEEAKDKMTPLHLASGWGQEKIAQCLLEHGCEINLQDHEGNTPLHLAILNQHPALIEILLRQANIDLKIKNSSGQSPFAAALLRKNIQATSLILRKEPRAAEQTDNKGKNFLHLAVLDGDIETVLSLISVNVNVNSRVQDNLGKTALHLAVESGFEMIVRNLLLAGANINDLTFNKKTALHLIAECNHLYLLQISNILIENGIDFNALDNGLNNALHLAVQNANLQVVKVLLTTTDIDVYAKNSKGMSPLHLLGVYGKDNSSSILDLFKENIKDFSLDQKDAKGNTVLLLAYQNGNGNLCRSLIKYGATIGTYNEDGVSIFNYPVASKQLIFKLLDILNKESPWVEAEICLECRNKFSITNRKHHCRHCGRVLCKKCSEKEVSILKFNCQKPVRVCDLCFDVLTAGAGNI
ncbi:unnamed protein product [Brachionus calyciflorus]|uniref:Ankyrin repeat and FYVE domain-containing protein 1 n=1 Tax=Brachionus calyciflorus TaxID=104777 RepID=A0A813WJ15_9BILA|nr:unnamed protein product [Brachionus calyciflorus]